ncbi:hypothetical protein D3C83_213500 [compost metagenome]
MVLVTSRSGLPTAPANNEMLSSSSNDPSRSSTTKWSASALKSADFLGSSYGPG